MSNNTIRVFEAFAGYGSQSIALQRLANDFADFRFTVVGISEIDKHAIAAYRAIHGDHAPNFGDIMHIDWLQVPDFDLLTYSFPCQDISSAGRQRGFAQGSGTRSSCLWACADAISAKHPKWLLMEYSPLFLGYTRDHKGKVVSHNLKDISNTIVASNHGRNGSTAQYLVEPMIYSSPHGFNFGGGKNLAPTVTSSAYADNNFLVKDFRIRKLTPRECFRLMDVADSDIDKIQQAGISKTQQYKLAGNSIVVSCLYHVFRKMFIDHSNEQKGYVQLSLF